MADQVSAIVHVVQEDRDGIKRLIGVRHDYDEAIGLAQGEVGGDALEWREADGGITAEGGPGRLLSIQQAQTTLPLTPLPAQILDAQTLHPGASMLVVVEPSATLDSIDRLIAVLHDREPEVRFTVMQGVEVMADTFAPYLARRYGNIIGIGLDGSWPEEMPEGDRDYWRSEAEATRRATVRDAFADPVDE